MSLPKGSTLDLDASDITMTSTTAPAEELAEAMGVEPVEPQTGKADEAGAGDGDGAGDDEKPGEESAAETGKADDEGDDDPSDEEASAAGKTLSKRKQRGDMRARLDAATRERHDAERREAKALGQLETLTKQLEELKQSNPGAAARTTGETKPEPKKAPVYDDFVNEPDPMGAYQRAITEHAITEKTAGLEAQIKALESTIKSERDRGTAAEQQRATEQAVQAFNGRVDEARKRYADFDTVVNSDLEVSRVLQHTIVTSEIGPDIAYYLGMHPEEAAQLSEQTNDLVQQMANATTPAEQMALNSKIDRLLGKLEARVEAAKSGSAPAAKPEKRPAPPVSPAGSSGPVTSAVDDEHSSVDDYIAQRNKTAVRRR